MTASHAKGLPGGAGDGGLAPPVPACDRRPRLLIAEDDAEGRELLVAIAESLGYDAVAVADGEAALAAASHERVDLVLSDVGMPRLDGFELCRRLKAAPATRLIPVVLITGIGEEFRATGIEAGADEFLGKPVSRHELNLRLRALLRMKFFTDELDSAEAVLCTLGRSIEGKDAYTEGHCERLAAMALPLGGQLGLAEPELRGLRLGAFLHDLGKVAVPDAILLKAGPLSPEERRIVEHHPVRGEEICRPLRSLQHVLPIIRHHHERWDGGGYPDGLAGSAIPLTARILQILDIFDALTTARPYRQPMAPAEAVQVLETEARRGWRDPRVVQAFAALLDGLREA
ncbi:MAG: HD-GYP domain-containing protein [Candidatus Methylomirabilales bacterium]